jgi:nicotinamidase-related amidase
VAAVDPRTSALLVVDLQNDTVGEQGAFAADGAALFAARHGVIEKAKQLVGAARTAGMPVIFVWHVDEPGHRDSTRNAKLFRDIAASDGLVRGTWGAAPVEGLEPEDGDAVVEKQRMSAFNSTTLDTKLRGLGTTTIVVCGAWTNFAIEHTCRDGADYGYEVVLAADATATIADDWQDAALSFALTRIADVRSVEELVAELGA